MTVRNLPAWASFFVPAARYWTFVDAVEREMRSRGLRVRTDDDAGSMFVVDEPGGFGLENLAQRCNAAPESTWDEIIKAHLKESLQGEIDRKALPIDDFDKVKSLLRVKLYDPALSPPGTLAGLPVADDLFAALVYDLPTAISPVSAENVQRWGKTVREVFDLALSNVWAESVPRVRALNAGDAKIFELSGSTFFLATHMLIAGGYVPAHSPHGLIVACPTRDLVLVHPIGAGPLVSAMQRMSNAAHGLHTEGPGSITASLYWVREGIFERLAIERGADGVAFTPSEAFTKVLNELVDGGTEEPATADHDPAEVRHEAAYEDSQPAQVLETAARIEAVLAEALPIEGRRSALTLNADVPMRLSSEGFVCPLTLFVRGAQDPSVFTEVFEHTSFVMFPRRVLGDTARCEAALRSALQRIGIEIGVAKVPLPDFKRVETLFPALFPFAVVESKLDSTAQDAAVKAEIKKAFTTVKL